MKNTIYKHCFRKGNFIILNVSKDNKIFYKNINEHIVECMQENKFDKEFKNE